MSIAIDKIYKKDSVLDVKILKRDGDWFIVPNELMEEWNEYTEILDREDESAEWYDACDRFEKYFGHMRTGGDLNNVQLYMKK